MKTQGEQPMSKLTTTTERIEQKEVKMESLAAPVIEDEVCKTGESSLKLQEVGTEAGESKKKMSQTEGYINKEDAGWYQENVNDAFDELKKDLLQDEQLHTLIEKFMFEVRRSMQSIKLQPKKELVEIRDIVDMIADKDGTPLKSFLKGELVLNKEVWQKLIDLKFGITVN